MELLTEEIDVLRLLAVSDRFLAGPGIECRFPVCIKQGGPHIPVGRSQVPPVAMPRGFSLRTWEAILVR